MSIPLDRLYHYLENLTNNNIIIYRWSPHGSKKPDDLIRKGSAIPDDWLEGMIKIHMICHDQEPLDYNYYSFDTFLNRVRNTAESRKIMPGMAPWADSEKFLHMLASSHLRTLTDSLFNFNDNFLLCHSEKNSDQLKIYEQNGFIGVYYWSHALIARDWYRYAQHDSMLIPNFENIKYDFLMYGRAWSGTREYRLKILELLLEHNLIPSCNTKFNPVDSDLHYTDHKFSNASLSISRSDLEYCVSTNNITSNASADYVSEDYAMCGLEVILETLFDDSRQHLTEKTLRPIACGRPFILVGTPGSLGYLRDYGFKTFSGYINETYDTIDDPLARLTAIVKELERISKLAPNEKMLLWEQLYEIADYNKKLFFSEQFFRGIVNEYLDNVNIGIEKCNQTQTGKWFRMANDPLITGINSVTNERTIQADAWFAKQSTIGINNSSQ